MMAQQQQGAKKQRTPQQVVIRMTKMRVRITILNISQLRAFRVCFGVPGLSLIRYSTIFAPPPLFTICMTWSRTANDHKSKLGSPRCQGPELTPILLDPPLLPLTEDKSECKTGKRRQGREKWGTRWCFSVFLFTQSGCVYRFRFRAMALRRKRAHLEGRNESWSRRRQEETRAKSWSNDNLSFENLATREAGG